MKILAIFIFILFPFFEIMGQGAKIESLRKEFTKLNTKNELIIGKYDSLFSRRDYLDQYLDNEVNIYLSCETAYNDKIIFLERKGDRGQKDLLDEYNMLQLEYDGLESKIVLNIRDFNYWNDITAKKLRNDFRTLGATDREKTHNSTLELGNYVKRIGELQEQASSFISSYDSCRLTCLVNCNCEEYINNYRQKLHLAETYMKRYNELLGEIMLQKTSKKDNYSNYRQSYNEYYSEYTERKNNLELGVQEIRKEQSKIRSNLKVLENRVHSMVQEEMKKDIMNILQKDFNELADLNNKIENELGESLVYYNLKELQRRAEIIISTLNPEIELGELSEFLTNTNLPKNRIIQDAERLLEISNQYFDLLVEFKSVIASYDAIPYFCLNAYPNYSDPIIDENLEIIEERIPFSSTSLESRTEEFLSLEELDLSNSNFSLDLIFKGHPNLQKLDLSNTRISSIKYLAGSNIQWLDLSNTRIDRNDLEYIKTMDEIEYINLSNTGIKKKDIYDLCFYLKVRRKNCVAQ